MFFKEPLTDGSSVASLEGSLFVRVYSTIWYKGLWSIRVS